MHGTGNYSINNGFLLIRTNNYNGLKSHCERTGKKSELTQIKVLDPYNKPVIGVNITLIDKKGNIISGTATNENGQATLEIDENVNKIGLALVGYDTYTIDYSGNVNYKLVLTDYITIENKTVVFKINSLNSDTLNLTLLSTDFTGNTKNKPDLEKPGRKSDKLKYRNRQLIK